MISVVEGSGSRGNDKSICIISSTGEYVNYKGVLKDHCDRTVDGAAEAFQRITQPFQEVM